MRLANLPLLARNKPFWRVYWIIAAVVIIGSAFVGDTRASAPFWRSPLWWTCTIFVGGYAIFWLTVGVAFLISDRNSRPR
jgi:uncharacterized membrane protein HdeD (DUF308 family)